MTSKQIFTLAATVVLALAVAGCGSDHPPPKPQVSISAPQAQTLQTGADAIKACKAEGLEEANCVSIYHDMIAGKQPQGAPTLAGCEAQHGVGNCGSNPIPNANGSGSVFLPLLAGAAMGAIGGYFLSKNLAPKGAYVPPTDWLRNRPAVAGPLNPVIGSGINSGKFSGNSPTATGSFADLNKAKLGDYQIGQVMPKGSDKAASMAFGVPAQGAKSAPFPNEQTTSTFKPQPAPPAYAAQRPGANGYNSGNYKQSAPSRSPYAPSGRSTRRY